MAVWTIPFESENGANEVVFFAAVVFFLTQIANVQAHQHSNNGLSINKKSISHSRPFVTI